MSGFDIQNGRFSFTVSYRKMKNDEGLSIRILGPAENQEVELLRFDCFLNAPHYHTAVYDHNTIRKIEESDAATWALDEIQQRLTQHIAAANGAKFSTSEEEGLDGWIQSLATQSRDLIRSSTS